MGRACFRAPEEKRNVSSTTIRRRISGGILALLLLLAGAAFITRSAWLAGNQTLLELEHSTRLEFARHGKAVDLEVPNIPGLKMFLHPNDSVITYRILAGKVWEPNETHWVSRFVRPGDVFVDIGANVGYYTLVASRLVGDTGHVYAFEPDPIAFSILERNVALNGITNVTLEQKAVSNEKGSIQLFLSEKNKGDHQIYEGNEERRAIDVEAVKLDDYFVDYDGAVNFVKIDTQGAEGVILEGMQEVIAANDDIVMAVEYWPHGLSGLGTDASGFLDLLRSHDFLFYDLGMGGGGIRPLREVYTKGLLQRFEGRNEKNFTNLLVLRGYEEGQKLVWKSLRANRLVKKDTPALLEAQAKWEREQRATIEREGAAATSLGGGMAYLISKRPDQRSAEKVQAVKNYFRATTPLLIAEREEAARAKAALENFKEGLIKNRMRKNAMP